MNERTVLMKPLPATEKCFDDEHISQKAAWDHFSMLKNQRLTFQIAYQKKTADLDEETPAELFISSPLKKHLKLYSIEPVPVYKPCYPDADDNYLRKTPGFFPDLLMPVTEPWHRVFFRRLRAFFVVIEDRNGIEPGTYPVTFTFRMNGKRIGRTSVTVEVLDAELAPQKLIYTNWFHMDCLSNYYGCPVYGKRHWEIIENYIREAVAEGCNMMLTPILTPPLDTGKGWHRADVGLVDITRTEDGYTFGYEKLDRFMDLCDRCGVAWFEMSHLFTQWSATHAPQVFARVNGRKKQIFGWDTDAQSPEYVAFLRMFIRDLLDHLRSRGLDRRCFFHISDEPNMAVFDSYVAAKNSVIDLFEGYPVIDALSDYEFYEQGQIAMPIPAVTNAEPFLKNDLPMRWTYYCCAQYKDVSNRFLAMPGQRTEILGVQLYKYRIDGFLQWGFNFYNSASSWHVINPFTDLSGDNWVPAGDTFAVYPAPDGTAWKSLHGMLFSEALEDLRLLQTCEAKLGRDRVMELVMQDVPEEITFTSYPKDAAYLLHLKERLFDALRTN